MAKSKRVVIGSVIKSKDKGKPDYVKIRGDHALKDGQTLRLESKQSQLDSVEAAFAAGKLSDSAAQMIRERINKMPDFVRFEIVSLERME